MSVLGKPFTPPAAVVLQDYDRHGRVWALEIATGLLTPAAGRCHGFVRVREEPARGGPPVAAALYAEGAGAGTLWLQYGPERWDCSAVAVRQVSEPDGHRLFTVFGERGAELELRYPAPDPGPFDPAYGWIDTVADDFFLWAAERLTDAADAGDDTAAAAAARQALTEHFATGFLSA